MRLIVLVLVLLVAPACGPSQRQRTLVASFVATDAAHAGFVAFDRSHQAALVDKATSLEAGKASLEAYREKRARLVTLFESSYRAIAAAAIVTDDPKKLASLSQATALLADALRDLTDGALP